MQNIIKDDYEECFRRIYNNHSGRQNKHTKQHFIDKNSIHEIFIHFTPILW